MEETFASVTFEATLDELVEVALTSQRTSELARRSRRNAMLNGGVTVGIAILVVANPLWLDGYGVPAVVLIALIFAGGVAFLMGFAHDDSVKKRTRSFVSEYLRGAETLRCDIELRSSGFWVRQDNVEHLYKWSDVTAVEDTSIGVNIIGRNLLTVVRNRAFPNPEERDGFLKHARRLASPSESERF